ncbi:MAG: GNAT family N-acetyltransferase [Verrucomicrobiales bacterium]
MIEVRLMTEADIDAWELLQTELYGHEENAQDGLTHRDVEDLSGDLKDAIFLAFENGNPIGFVQLSLRDHVDGCLGSPVAYVDGLFVKPKDRGKGAGVELIEQAQQWATDHSCAELATDAEIDDLAAQDFHRAMGFEETNRIVQFRKTVS